MWLLSYFYNYNRKEIKEIKEIKDIEETKEIDEIDDFIFMIPKEDKKYLISSKDLESVKLQPVKINKKVLIFEKINLQNLNKDQLNDVLSVKLKPTIPNKKIEKYEPRHPVLCELHKKINIIK